MNRSLNNDLHSQDKQQQDAHDTRVVQANEYRRHHTTPNIGKHTPYPTHSIDDYLIDTNCATMVFAVTINALPSTK